MYKTIPEVYSFTSYSHDQIIEAIEQVRKQKGITKSLISFRIGYSKSLYFKLINRQMPFSKHSFTKFAEKYVPHLLGETSKSENIKLEMSSKEQDCIDYLKSKGYKIMKPVTEFVEL